MGRIGMLVLILFNLPVASSGQDPSFSQFYANRVYLNPAFVGLDGGISISGAARMQWISVDNGFSTYDFTIETQLPAVQVGLGLHLMKDVEGIANFTTNQAGLVFSYTIPGKYNNVHFGIEGRLVQRGIDWDKLVFSDELDKVYGQVYPTSMQPLLDQVMFGDLDFGVVWRNEGGIKFKNTGSRKVRSHLGISIHHLPYLFSSSAQGNDSFLNTGSQIAPRITLHGGMIIPVTIFKGTGMDISISPNFKLDNQGYRWFNFDKNISVGTFGLYALVNNFYLGALYQNRVFAPNHLHTDAFILAIGGYANTKKRQKANNPNLFFGLSVDLNTTGLGPAAGSVFELNFRYRFTENAFMSGSKKGKRTSRKRILDCKSFF
jgi:type IX secretion system PorP/SprF family membrane protein